MGDDSIAALDLTDSEYEVVQSPFRNKYRAYDADGNLVLRGKQKLFELSEEFPFVDADGNPAFTVQASGVLDVAGDYTLVDDRTGDPLAEITSRSRAVELLRSLHAVFGLIPHSYDVTTPDGRRIGAIDGQLSLRDTYRVRVDRGAGVPREALLAAAMVVDAIEDN